MFTGLLKQFLKKTLAIGIPIACILTFTLNAAYAAKGTGVIHVDAASWDGTTLIADGSDATSPKRGGGPVGVFDAADDSSLGTANLSNSGNWDFTGNTCAENIYVTQDAVTSADFPVANGCGVPPGNTPPVANDDPDYTVAVDAVLNVAAPGVLGNDTDADNDPLTAELDTDVSTGTLNLNADGSFDYTPGAVGEVTFTYFANDGTDLSDIAALVTITVTPAVILPDPRVFAPQTDFKIMMNYELGMHCTGFEFAYCCVLPAYNSILAQVIKPNQSAPQHGGDYPMLLAGDPNEGLDALGRETVVRDGGELDASGNFKKYVLKYWHDAQDRNDGRGKVQTSTLISASEGNSLFSWNTKFDSALLDPDTGKFVTGDYNGSQGVVLGDGDVDDPADNYQNGVWNHLYFYNGLEGEFACSAPAASVGNRCSVDSDCDTGAGSGNGFCDVNSIEANKIRLGVNGHIVYPTDCGPALHPIGPVTTDPNDPTRTIANDCGGFSNGNVLTFSGHKGTVVYTQMKVLENLPVMLTSPDIWEALGLPLTTFEDTIDFFADPGLVDEDSVRPFVVMNAQMYDYDPAASDGAGAATLDSAGDPVIGFGTAPIDIPNCERCHSNGPDGSFVDIPDSESAGVIDADPATPGVQLEVANTPNADPAQYARVVQEYDYWNAYYGIDKAQGDSDWYSRLKSAAISMLGGHDVQHGTSFTANYPGCGPDAIPSSACDAGGAAPQNTRLGHESVICQKCHADNVIAVVKSAECGIGNETLGTVSCAQGTLIKPVTEAIHNNHRGISSGGPIAFTDSLGRDGGCQGCHPAHRSDGDMAGYPITLAGTNRYFDGDNRGASGGCFVGRDVHSNPNKDNDGVETVAHLNAVGQWLEDNVAHDNGGDNGIWCTNCHNQLGQELWKAENMESLVHGVGLNNPRAEPTLAAVAAAVGTTEEQAMAWLDPKDTDAEDSTYDIWKTDPGLCNYVAGYFGVIPVDSAHDGNVATVEVNVTSKAACSTGDGTGLINCSAEYPGAPDFHICGIVDGDGDFSVNAMDFCTTPDCVADAQAILGDPAVTGSVAVPVPFSAATDGRDHWLSAGEPHCADCHAAPFVEQSGNINPYPPFNYPRKASLMRYSKGHQNISCQGCHESIHGLYPVTPNVDTTTYAQAAALNADGSHGPLKCGTCHEVDGKGIPTWMANGIKYNGGNIRTYDDAVAWMHTFTDEVSPLEDGGVCMNCHQDRSNKVVEDAGKWLRHSFVGRIGRQLQDKVEIETFGDVAGGSFVDADDMAGLTSTVCSSCHSLQGGPSGAFVDLATCDNAIWKSHNIDGRLAEKVWEYVSVSQNGVDPSGSVCGW